MSEDVKRGGWRWTRRSVLAALGTPGVLRFRDEVLVPYLAHRTLLVLVVCFAANVFPANPGFHALPGNPVFDPWLRWDSEHYLHIATLGYGPNASYRANGFFPLYPWLVRIVAIVLPVAWAALLVANACAIGALALLHDLAVRISGPEYARRVVWVMLLFPTSFYQTAAYSESVYLLASIGTVVAWKSGRPWWAAAGAAAATLARPVGGIALTLPFAVGWLVRSRKRADFPLWCVGAVAGVLGLLVTFRVATGDALGFLHAPGVQNLRVFWTDEKPPSAWAVLLDEGVGRNLMVRLLNWGAVGLVVLCSISLLRRKEIELGLLALVSVALPLYFHAGLFDAASMARYSLSAFPVLLVIATWTPSGMSARAYDSGAQMLQIVLASLFATWRWAE